MKSRKQIMAEKVAKIHIPEGKKAKEGKIDEQRAESIIFGGAAKPAPEKKPEEPKPAPKAKGKPAPKKAPAAKPASVASHPAPEPADRPHRKPPERRKHIRSFTISDPAYDTFNQWCKGKTISMSEILERFLTTFNTDEEFKKSVVSRIYNMG